MIKLIGIAPCYNELSKGHLVRFLNNAPKVVDGLVLLDDASTDGSYELMCEKVPHVIKNRNNMFTRELFNQQRLIEKALEVYPDLTHLINMNIDTTFSPSCYKDGEALLHKACEKYSSAYAMINLREIHLWRSTSWWRTDGAWRWREAERIYVRNDDLSIKNKWYKGLHVSKDVADFQHTLSLSKMDEYSLAIGVHWGFFSKKSIEDKVSNYLNLESWRAVPCPDDFKSHSVFNLLDEYDLIVKEIHPDWFDDDLKKDILLETRRPKQISYYPLLRDYDYAKAECYKNHFMMRCKFYNEVEEHYNI